MSEHTKIISYSDEHTEGIKIDKYVGCWVITSSFHVRVQRKPNWFHRLMARLLLGWKWEDKE